MSSVVGGGWSGGGGFLDEELSEDHARRSMGFAQAPTLFTVVGAGAMTRTGSQLRLRLAWPACSLFGGLSGRPSMSTLP